MDKKGNISRIVLIGMPCSGKSSIGKAVANHYAFDYVDMDDLIEEKANKSIERIFAEDGEDAFRELEYLVSLDVSKLDNIVIATGGGVIMRPKSIEAVIPKSFVVFIHREFFLLATTPKRILDKRPMLKKMSFDELMKLYKLRLPLYRKYCHVEVSNNQNRDDTINKIIQIIDRKNRNNEENPSN